MDFFRVSFMNENELIRLNQEGLFPGPGESEELFSERASFCLKLKNSKESLLPNSEEANGELLSRISSKSKKLLGIAPSWIPIYFSNYKLAPWHGGVAWIFRQDDVSPLSAFFQIRKSAKKEGKLFWGYSIEEILLHELSHVLRMSFEEPKYEEWLAYKSSTNSFRRFFGPLFQSAKESMLLVILLIISLIIQFALNEVSLSNWLIAQLPWITFLCFLCIRLTLKNLTIKKTIQNVTPILKKNIDPLHLLYRLTDREIDLFSRMKPEDIVDYFKSNLKKELRIKLIKNTYLI